MSENIPYFVSNEPYELFYKNESTATPVGAHTHNVAEIYLTLTDLPDVLLNDTVSRVQKGSLIIIPPFCVHQLYHGQNVKYERYIINFNVQWLENILRSDQVLTECMKQSYRPLILPLEKKQLEALTSAMNKVMPIIREKSIKSTAEFFSLLAVLESAVSSAYENMSLQNVVVSKSQKTVNDIIAYINGHLEENITLTDISDHFFLNRDYLSRLFMKHAHTSIGRYIAIQRIAKAQEYLREGMTVTQVSEKMGLSSYAYFFKVFQKMTGSSPSQYRKGVTS